MPFQKKKTNADPIVVAKNVIIVPKKANKIGLFIIILFSPSLELAYANSLLILS